MTNINAMVARAAAAERDRRGYTPAPSDFTRALQSTALKADVKAAKANYRRHLQVVPR